MQHWFAFKLTYASGPTHSMNMLPCTALFKFLEPIGTIRILPESKDSIQWYVVCSLDE